MSARTLKASVIIGGSMSSAFRSALSSTSSGLKMIGEEIANVERRQRLLGRSIETFGRMGRNVDKLRQEYAGLTREADRLRAAQSRLADVQGRIDANNARRSELGGRLGGAAATLGVVAAAAFQPVRAAVQFETAMLGVAKQVEGTRDAAGNLTPVYFDMARQIQRLGREIPLATVELADMAAAGARMGVARSELVGFTRTAAMMADAFEMPAGALADDMGKIAGLFGIPIPKIGELADAINYLDDRTMSTGGGIIDVMRRIGGMAATLRMPSKEAAALGSTFLTLGSSAEVAGTASNAVMRILGAATAQSKRVRNGLLSIGMDPADVQARMAKDSTGTILSVLDKLNSLSAEQRMVAATRIFGAEYGDDIAKLATGAGEYRRQLALVQSEQSKGSMQREFEARLKTTGAQWQITKNRMTEVAVAIGGALLPAVNSLLASAGPLVERFADWSRANPGVVKGVIGTALALSGLRVATLGVAYAWTVVKGPALSVLGFIARWRASGAVAAMGRFGGAAMRVATGMRTIGAAIAAVGGGPITLAVAALTAAALVVRKYWQPIGAFMSGAMQGVRDMMGPAFAELGAALAPLRPLWDAMTGAIGRAWDWIVRLLQPVNMTAAELEGAANSGRTFGRVVGAVMGHVVRQVAMVVKAVGWIATVAVAVGSVVADKIGGAWDRVRAIVGSAIDWIAQKMAPILAGAATVGGLVTSAAGALGFTAAPQPAAAGGAPAPARARVAPRIPKPAARGGGSVTHQANTFHIVQREGESTEDLARRIAEHTRQRDAAAKRGSLVDGVD